MEEEYNEAIHNLRGGGGGGEGGGGGGEEEEEEEEERPAHINKVKSVSVRCTLS
jgi:hypothetical protein